MSTKQFESDRFDRWWKTQDWDGAYTDVAWEAWWEAVRDSTDEEVIEVLAPVSTRELERLRAALTEISELDLEGDASLADAMHIADEALNP